MNGSATGGRRGSPGAADSAVAGPRRFAPRPAEAQSARSETGDIRVVAVRPLPAPSDIQQEFPLGRRAAETVDCARREIRDILAGDRRRVLVVVGPCSIHDVNAAHDYAAFLLDQRRRFADDLLLLMRVYFEKPRTTVGWKGLINDPHLDGSFNIGGGLRLARSFLRDLAEDGVPIASEMLDPVSPQYLGDFVSWAAIGARTIESPTHREMASGLSMPVGLKNGTDGTWRTAINAMSSASQPHHFLGIDVNGRISLVATAGNRDTHLVLRGGSEAPNYHPQSIREASAALAAQGLCPGVMVDCSHDNSNKDYTQQPRVCRDLAAQIRDSAPIVGVMIESNLVAGKQPFPPEAGHTLRYGQSITDGCADLATTSLMLEELASAVRAVRATRRRSVSRPADAQAPNPPI